MRNLKKNQVQWNCQFFSFFSTTHGLYNHFKAMGFLTLSVYFTFWLCHVLYFWSSGCVLVCLLSVTVRGECCIFLSEQTRMTTLDHLNTVHWQYCLIWYSSTIVLPQNQGPISVLLREEFCPEKW